MTLRAYPHNLSRRLVRRRRPTGETLCLEISRGRAKHKLRPLSAPVFLIGAASDSDLVLGDMQFPDGYAYVYLRDGELSIRWLGEGPELQVNDWPVQVSPLKVGDRISAGPFEFRVVQEDSPGGDAHDAPRHQLRILSFDDAAEAAAGEQAVNQLLADIRQQVLVLDTRRACA
jgi:hypothetical protein